MGETDYLFVYGLLRKGLEAHDLLASKRVRFVATGRISGRLYDMGRYPAVVRADDDDEGTVSGEVYELQDADAVLPELDKFEEYDREEPDASPYIRQRVSVRLAGGSAQEIVAWAYLFNPRNGLPEGTRILSGDYLAHRRRGVSRPKHR